MSNSVSARGGNAFPPGRGSGTRPSKARPNQYVVTVRATGDVTGVLFTKALLAFGTTVSNAEPATYGDLTVSQHDTLPFILPSMGLSLKDDTIVQGRSKQLDFSALTLGKKVWLAWVHTDDVTDVQPTDEVVAATNLGTLGP